MSEDEKVSQQDPMDSRSDSKYHRAIRTERPNHPCLLTVQTCSCSSSDFAVTSGLLPCKIRRTHAQNRSDHRVIKTSIPTVLRLQVPECERPYQQRNPKISCAQSEGFHSRASPLHAYPDLRWQVSYSVVSEKLEALNSLPQNRSFSHSRTK